MPKYYIWRDRWDQDKVSIATLGGGAKLIEMFRVDAQHLPDICNVDISALVPGRIEPLKSVKIEK